MKGFKKPTDRWTQKTVLSAYRAARRTGFDRHNEIGVRGLTLRIQKTTGACSWFAVSALNGIKLRAKIADVNPDAAEIPTAEDVAVALRIALANREAKDIANTRQRPAAGIDGLLAQLPAVAEARKVATDTSPLEALRRLIKTICEQSLTLGQWLVVYRYIERNHRGKPLGPDSVKVAENRIRNFVPEHLDVPLHELTTEGLADSIELREKGQGAVYFGEAAKPRKAIKPATINRGRSSLNSCLNYAVKHGAIDRNPCAGIKGRFVDKNAAKNLRKPVTLEERAVLLAACDAPDLPAFFPVMVRLALATGMRRGELMNLDWQHVPLSSMASITVLGTKAKAGTTREIPLENPAVISMLKAWRKQSGAESISGYVFVHPETGKQLADVDAWWTRVTREADIKRMDADGNMVYLHFHSLRHTFCTAVYKAVAFVAAKEICGHEDVRTAERYTHATDDEKRLAMRGVG